MAMVDSSSSAAAVRATGAVAPSEGSLFVDLDLTGRTLKLAPPAFL
jgi:hypothetical protein